MRSKKYINNYKKKYISKRKKGRKVRRLKKSKKNRRLNDNQLGGGLPFAGTLKNLIGLTHNKEKDMDGLLDNLCLVNNLKRP